MAISPSRGALKRQNKRVNRAVRKVLRTFFHYLEAAFDPVFEGAWNPVRQLGSLTFFQYWVVAITGIYIYIFFDTTVDGAYESVEWMTGQWYLAGLMRSLHRYASDAMVALTMLHLLREFAYGRFRGARWFAWFTGVPLIWFLFFSGVSGYWLVWDQLAQYVAIGSMEWLDWLGIFGKTIANNFLKPGAMTDRFFTLLVFIHIFVPLFLLFIMWFHVMRLKQPRINPPRGLAWGSLAALIVLSLIFPATSHDKADLSTMTPVLNFDWFFLPAYPLFDAIGPGPMWGAAIGLTLLISLAPVIPRFHRPPAALVTLDKCNGCSRCAADCPFDAVEMKPRSDGAKFDQEAVVIADRCVACGICVGACPVSTPFRQDEELVTGIDIVDPTLKMLRIQTDGAMKAAREQSRAMGENAICVAVFGCANGVGAGALKARAQERGIQAAIAEISMPCTGMLPPSFIDYALSRGEMDGVMVTGCGENACFYRFGQFWMEDRINQQRDPHLRKRVRRERLALVWAAPTEVNKTADAMEQFVERLGALEKEKEGA